MVESLPIGCQTLTARFFHHEPLHPEELISLNQYLDDTLQKSAWYLPAGLMLTLAGGTASVWAGFTVGADPYQPEQLHGVKLLVREGENLAAGLALLGHEVIRRMLPFDAERSSVFLAGLYACLAVIKHLGRVVVIHTEKSVRQGLAMKILGFDGNLVI